MSLNLYSAPEAAFLPRPRRLCEAELLAQRIFWSVAWALLSCAATGIMICLAEWHDPGDSSIVADAFPFWKVVIPCSFAGSGSCASLVFSVRVFLSGKFRPILWLLPLSAFQISVFLCFDWGGLFETGKPSFSAFLIRVRFISEMMLSRGTAGFLFYILSSLAVIRFIRWDQDRNADIEAASIRLIAAAARGSGTVDSISAPLKSRSGKGSESPGMPIGQS